MMDHLLMNVNLWIIPKRTKEERDGAYLIPGGSTYPAEIPLAYLVPEIPPNPVPSQSGDPATAAPKLRPFAPIKRKLGSSFGTTSTRLLSDLDPAPEAANLCEPSSLLFRSKQSTPSIPPFDDVLLHSQIARNRSPCRDLRPTLTKLPSSTSGLSLFVVARLRSFSGVPFQLDRELRHFDRNYRRELAHWEGFYNWNKVKVRYCDGSSFTGDIEAVDPAKRVFYRGSRIWFAIVDELLAKGMNKAQNALLSGCSAGALASILHCDKFRDLLPSTTKVKCFSDAGFFINAKDISGVERIKAFFEDVMVTHGSAKNLPASCTARLPPSLCFFPQYVVQTLRTPLFVLNAAYDAWQIKNILAPSSSDSSGAWRKCKLDIKACSSAQSQTIQGFRAEFLNAVSGLRNSPSAGLFIDSCHAHCQSGRQAVWLDSGSTIVDNNPIGKAVADWFYDRTATKLIDNCSYPCNPSCHDVADDS